MNIFSIFLIGACIFVTLIIVTVILRRMTMNRRIQQLRGLPEDQLNAIVIANSRIAKIYMFSICSNLSLVMLLVAVYFMLLHDSLLILIAIVFGVLIPVSLERIQYYKAIKLRLTQEA